MKQSKTGKISEFDAGQMIGMVVVLEAIERGDIEESLRRKIKQHCVDSLEEYFDKPPEDVLLTISKQLDESGIL